MTVTQDVSMPAPPELGGGLPVLGHVLPFSRDPVKFLVAAQEEIGNIFSFRVLGRKFTVVCGPEASDAVFRASDHTMGRKRAYRSMTPIFGKGVLFDLPPEQFKEHVGFLQPALAAKSVSGYRAAMLDEVENYVSGWDTEGTVDLVDVMSELSIFVATRCMIGPGFRHRVGPRLASLFDDLKAAGRLGWLVGENLPLPAFRRRDRARTTLVELITEEIRAGRANGSTADPLVDHLLKSRYSDGRALTDDVMASLLLAVVVAGEHNTAAVAAWTGVLLLLDPSRAARVVAEQAQFSAPSDDFRALRELRKCVTEAGRMHPPTTLLLRDAEQDFLYNGYRIARGSTVMLSPAASQRLAHVFPDPHRYDPDRFPDGPHTANPNPLLTFGGGGHRCTGMNFAYQEIMIMWNVLLRHFELELVDSDIRPDYNATTAIPVKPCRVRYRRRSRVPGSKSARTSTKTSTPESES